MYHEITIHLFGTTGERAGEIFDELDSYCYALPDGYPFRTFIMMISREDDVMEVHDLNIKTDSTE